MTQIGKLVLTIYSIVVIVGFVARDLKRGDKCWKGALLVPILILLINI